MMISIRSKSAPVPQSVPTRGNGAKTEPRRYHNARWDAQITRASPRRSALSPDGSFGVSCRITNPIRSVFDTLREGLRGVPHGSTSDPFLLRAPPRAAVRNLPRLTSGGPLAVIAPL
jgi:hypothetical protein